MGYLTRAQIQAAQDLAYLDEPVPEWGEDPICLVQLSAGEMEAFHRELEASPGNADGMQRILIYCAVNNPQDRVRLFSEEDIEMLKGKNIDVLNRLQHKALGLQGLGPEKVDALKKTLAAAPSADSRIASPSPLGT